MWLNKLKFKTLLEQKTAFAYNRFNDGEWQIISNIPRNIRGEYRFNPNIPLHQHFRAQLESALVYKDSSYYIGMPDKRITNNTCYSDLIQLADQPTKNITSSVMFTNENFTHYLKYIYPLYSEYTSIVLVCNPRAISTRLAFAKNIKHIVKVQPPVAWKKLPNLRDQLTNVIDNLNEHTLFLFSAGPVGKVLLKESYIKTKAHTYIDIGSLHDSMTGLGKTRGYLRENPYLDI